MHLYWRKVYSLFPCKGLMTRDARCECSAMSQCNFHDHLVERKGKAHTADTIVTIETAEFSRRC